MTIAQTLYMTALIEQAATVARQSTKRAFDPQGRILVDVCLSDLKLPELMMEITHQTGDDYCLDHEGLAKALGRTPSTMTTVSLDITNIFDLKAQFNQIIAPHIQQQLARSKMSIIALQQEFHFHLALVGRVYKQIKPELKYLAINNAHLQAMLELNALILRVFGEAVVNATRRDASIDCSQLNKVLNNARQQLVPQAHQLFMHALVNHSGIIFNPEELDNVGTYSLMHLAKATTATANDLLHTDSSRGLATLITGSENTAHNRTAGAYCAHRELITHLLHTDGTVTTHLHPRIQIHTPLPVLKTGFALDAEYASDVAVKLETIVSEYQLRHRFSMQPEKSHAFIYNSYTAINDRLGFTDNNLQKQSAEHILQGIHIYNTQAFTQTNGIICLIINNSVNGFGDTLGYGSNSLQTEATLMAELALLHSLYDVLSSEEHGQLKDILSLYNQYLHTDRRPAYFSQSAAGTDAIHLLHSLKNKWQKQTLPKTNNLFTQAQLALQQLIAHDLHYNHSHAKLVQTLAVFVEEISLSGCKSGNERTQMINGRVAVLDELLHKDSESPIKTALKRIAQRDMTAVASLKSELDHEYNQRGLQGAVSLISLVDQGGSAKIQAKPGHPFYRSYNYGEEPRAVMTYLQQTNAAAMQAHKELTQYMQTAWAGDRQSLWARLNSSPLGLAGAILAIVTVIPTLVVALYNIIDNDQRTARTQAHNQFLQQRYLSKQQDPLNDSAQALAILGRSDDANVLPVTSLARLPSTSVVKETSTDLFSSNQNTDSLDTIDTDDDLTSQHDTVSHGVHL